MKNPDRPFGDLLWARISDIEHSLIDMVMVSALMTDLDKAVLIGENTMLDMNLVRYLLKMGKPNGKKLVIYTCDDSSLAADNTILY